MIDITLNNGTLTARIAALGAELVSLTDADGRELMTNADPAYWTGHAPILFPIVGRLNDDRYRVGGRTYHLPQHGFARRRDFVPVEQSATHVRFRLTDDAESRAVYPFAFMLEVEHALDGATITTTVTVTNPGDGDLPASVGFHHAFAWPLPYGHDRADHRIVFDAAEPGHLAAIAPGGLIAQETAASPLDGDTLVLRDALFANDALVWDPAQSHGLRYGASTGPQLRIAFPDTDKLGIWTKPGAAFVCVEPWAGIADPVGFAGELWDKPGIHRIAPGGNRRFRMAVTLER